VGLLEEPGHDLGVESGVELGSQLLQLPPQHVRVEQVSVVGDGAGTQGRVLERHRVRVLGAARPGRGVAGVPDGEVSLQGGELVVVEHMGNETHVLVDEQLLAVADGHARGLLAPMLEREEPVEGQERDGEPGSVDTEHTAGFLRSVVEGISRH
jgi:hypothetical protein